jgi:hypothetical protein
MLIELTDLSPPALSPRMTSGVMCTCAGPGPCQVVCRGANIHSQPIYPSACAGGGRCLSAFLSGAGHHPRFPQEARQGEPHLTSSGGNAGSVVGIHVLATAPRLLVHLLLRRQESLARLSASLWLTNHASSMKRLKCCAFLYVRSWAMR